VGIVGALRVLFPFQASSPLIFRLLFLLKVSLPFSVGIIVSRHVSSLLISTMDISVVPLLLKQ
jgi:hypothetical protein